MAQHTKPKGSYISFFSNKAKAHGGINLAQGIPGFDPPRELLNELSAIVHTNAHQYAPGLGHRELLELIAQRYAVDTGSLLVVQGATEGLSLVYTYLTKRIGRNFSALAFDPAYESYSKLPGILGQPFVAFPLNDNGEIDTEKLGWVIAARNVGLVFLNSPGNPYGKVLSRDEVDFLMQLSERLGFYLIFDAVYDELYFNEPPYIPVERVNERLFVVGSFSKSLCITGWRIGYIIHHKAHAAGLQSVHDYIGLCAPSLLQQALAGYLHKHRYAEEFKAELRTKIAHSFRLLSQTLNGLGYQIPQADGGCFVWAKLPNGLPNGFEFATRLYEENRVAIVPGEHFSPGKPDWVRINIARPINEIRAAAEEFTRFTQRHTP